ncbi:MAG: DUF2442 domain-containing protein [Pontiellaceae bacterium]|jgi:hypothetical protein|nr:DUF2442 domain-containing protein [Pontiellaceae bacterium]
MLEITEVKYDSGFTLRLSFSDGATGTVDLTDSLWGPVFEPLKDPEMFKKAFLSPVLHTVAWPNDADFAPEYLRERLTGMSSVQLLVAEEEGKYGA